VAVWCKVVEQGGVWRHVHTTVSSCDDLVKLYTDALSSGGLCPHCHHSARPQAVEELCLHKMEASLYARLAAVCDAHVAQQVRDLGHVPLSSCHSTALACMIQQAGQLEEGFMAQACCGCQAWLMHMRAWHWC